MKQVIKLIRAKRISEMAKSKYNSVVYSCANVSRVNTSLSFMVVKIGPFGFPQVHTIKRPDVLSIAENNPCVVVRDGRIYELQTWL